MFFVCTEWCYLDKVRSLIGRVNTVLFVFVILIKIRVKVCPRQHQLVTKIFNLFNAYDLNK